jgi:two-component system, cell cycle response regulator CtrA
MADDLHLLRNENAALRERIRQLENILVPTIDVPIEFGLTATETRVFAHLLTRSLVSKRALHTAAYGHLIDEAPDESVLESHISKLRRKLRPHGFQIENERFAGYRLTGPREQFGVHHG